MDHYLIVYLIFAYNSTLCSYFVPTILRASSCSSWLQLYESRGCSLVAQIKKPDCYLSL